MGMSVLDRLSKQQASRPQNNGGRVKGIFHQWKDGSNDIRLAGEFVEVRTHFIAPAPKRNDRGLCMPNAFQGDDKLPQVINCLNWDIATERPKKDKTCPICKLNAIARAVLADKPADAEKKFFEDLRAATRATTTLKWNVIDRNDPMIVAVNDGKESQVLGFKICSIGPEAAADIFGIFKQVGYDINDPDKGIDIEVMREQGKRTTYSARAVISGTSLKVSPFTAEEKALVLHDLKMWCGKMVDANKIVDALYDDLREVISLNINEGSDDTGTTDSAVDGEVEDIQVPATVVKQAPAPAPKPVVKAPAAPAAAKTAPVVANTAAAQQRPASAPTAGKVPSSVLDRLGKKTVSAPAPAPAAASDENEALQEAIGDVDGDGILDGTDAKKK